MSSPVPASPRATISGPGETVELSTTPQQAVSKETQTGTAPFLVASGILLSRLFGLVRIRIFSHFLGQETLAADAFNAAFRIPNYLQNMFGEGALSASFIPVYAKLLAEGDEEEAGRVAGAIFGLLALALSVLVVAGVVATPVFIDLIAAGFEGAKRELAIRLVRILFPGAATLVLSAWCLGILNSHRRFFLSYSAPVLWNVAMIAALVFYGGSVGQSGLVVRLAWASFAGSVMQFAVQLPTVLRLVSRLRFSLNVTSAHVRTVLSNFAPVVVSRGVVQISAYIDTFIASWLPTGAVTGLINAQILYVLPVSLFGMSVSAAELPTMSGTVGSDEVVREHLGRRLNAGLQQIAFFIVPSAMAFLALGDVVAGAVLQTGRFTRADTVYVWGILAGSAVGLLASTLARLYSSAYYALRDTRTPLRFAIVRVTLTALLGCFAALWLPQVIGIETRWGVAGLTASAGLAGWVEFALLRGTMNRRIGRTGLRAWFVARLWMAAAAGAAAAWLVKLWTASMHPFLAAVFVLGLYGLVYFAAAWLLGVPQVTGVLARLKRVV
jgi:putative peptidoglycan lipid II flippase